MLLLHLTEPNCRYFIYYYCEFLKLSFYRNAILEQILALDNLRRVGDFGRYGKNQGFYYLTQNLSNPAFCLEEFLEICEKTYLNLCFINVSHYYY